jgi:hypothetical protein
MCIRLVAHLAKPRSHVTAFDNTRELLDRLLVDHIAVKHQNRLRFYGKHSLKPDRRPRAIVPIKKTIERMRRRMAQSVSLAA